MVVKKYLCDRCGKEREKVNRPEIRIGKKTVNNVCCLTAKSATGYQRDIDLCEDCLKEFESWVNVKEEV